MNALTMTGTPDILRLPVPVGLRLRDMATGRFVTGDLSVEVKRDVPLARAYALSPTPSGHWANPSLYEKFRDFPADPAQWPPLARTHRVAVDDPTRQYLPLRFDAALPFNGTYVWPGWPDLPPDALGPLLAAPSAAPAYLPLFGTSAYRAGALARAYAHLAFRQGPDTFTDAAWAVMTLSLAGKVIGVGLSDARGAIGVYFPYPLVPDLTPAQKTQGRAVVTWNVTVAVYSDALPADSVPALADVLAQMTRPARKVIATLSSLNSAYPTQILTLNRPLVLRSAVNATDHASSLFLRPA